MDKKVELSTSEAVEATVEAIQREISLAAATIRAGFAILDDVEEHTKRWLPEFPALLKAQMAQLARCVEAIEEGAEDATKRMTGDMMPPVEVIRHPVTPLLTVTS
jgi:hypothetical protein